MIESFKESRSLSAAPSPELSFEAPRDWSCLTARAQGSLCAPDPSVSLMCSGELSGSGVSGQCCSPSFWVSFLWLQVCCAAFRQMLCLTNFFSWTKLSEIWIQRVWLGARASLPMWKRQPLSWKVCSINRQVTHCVNIVIYVLQLGELRHGLVYS